MRLGDAGLQRGDLRRETDDRAVLLGVVLQERGALRLFLGELERETLRHRIHVLDLTLDGERRARHLVLQRRDTPLGALDLG